MALPSSGTLSISDIASEFGDTAPNSMSEFYRGGGLVPDSATNSSVPTSGAIAIGNFYGAANRAAVPLTISANTQNYDVYTQASASPAYVAGTSDITLTIDSGVFVGSSSTGTYALSIPSSFNPADTVTIVNNGTVIGRGGNGGSGGAARSVAPVCPPAGSGGGGGNAVYVNFPTVITNNGTLAGGGGGGGGGRGALVISPTPPKSPNPIARYGGGGGGGAAGYTAGSGGSGGPASPAPAGAYPGSPGSSGSTTAGGSGGNGPGPAGSGGAGGGQGANGGSGGPSPYGGGGSGGTRGYYVVGNPFVTYPATGTRLGLVS